MPAAQARLIAQALQRFEKLKPAYVDLKRANQAWRVGHTQDSTIGAGHLRIINWYKGAYGEEQMLRQDANDKLVVSQGKAHRRGWLIALETAGLVLLSYIIITK